MHSLRWREEEVSSGTTCLLPLRADRRCDIIASSINDEGAMPFRDKGFFIEFVHALTRVIQKDTLLICFKLSRLCTHCVDDSSMSVSFHDLVLSQDHELPLDRRRLVPFDHDGSEMVDLDGLPMNTPTETLQSIDQVRTDIFYSAGCILIC